LVAQQEVKGVREVLTFASQRLDDVERLGDEAGRQELVTLLQGLKARMESQGD
jgi:hypothetical protein